MAIEFCSENSTLVMNPRISFSYDLSQSDTVPIEQTLFRSNSKTGVDFDFCIGENSENQSSSADELFSCGKIIPTQLKKINTRQKQSNSPKQNILLNLSPKMAKIEADRTENKNSKSFWGFKRSSSLNCGSGYAPSLCPLPLMSRSNSTGSANSNSKKSSVSRENQNAQKQNLLKSSSSVVSRSSSLKPPMKKTYGSYGSGVNPTLNVHSGNFFGLGSIFSNGKDKNKKK